MVKSRNKIIIVISWLLVAVVMGIIFWLSSRTADISSGQSSGVIQWIKNVFGFEVSSFVIRKTAHCLEFAGLCFLVNNALYQTFKVKKPIWSIIITSAYALSDEIHQIFVPGRACQFLDWTIDTMGAVLGTAIFLLAFWFVFKFIFKGDKNENSVSCS